MTARGAPIFADTHTSIIEENLKKILKICDSEMPPECSEVFSWTSVNYFTMVEENEMKCPLSEGF